MERLKDKFESLVIKKQRCWGWRGYFFSEGSTQLKCDTKTLYGHRTSWLINVGKIPNGMHVKHTCKNKVCCNPKHLYLEEKNKNRPHQTLKKGFERHVIKQMGCWNWRGAKTEKGYGVFNSNKKTYLAHRASWLINNGDIPDNICICHKCDNPICTNPEHLFLGTKSENAKDMIRKGRSITYGKFGEKSIRSKLTNVQRKEIINLRNKRVSTLEISKEFKVSQGTIYYVIKTRDDWKSS